MSISFSVRHNSLFLLLADHLIKHGWFALGEYSYLESAKSIACFNNNEAKQLRSVWVIPGQTTDVSLSPPSVTCCQGKDRAATVESNCGSQSILIHAHTERTEAAASRLRRQTLGMKKETTESKYFSSLFDSIIFYYFSLSTLNMRVSHQMSTSPGYQAPL